MNANTLDAPRLPTVVKRSKRDWHLTSCKVDREVVAKLDRIAEAASCTRSDLIAMACERFVEEQAA